MITQPHPSIFKNLSVRVGCSDLEDGTMKFDGRTDTAKVIQHRQTFLQAMGSSLEMTTLLRITYGENMAYDRILDVDKNDLGRGMLANDEIEPADALFTVAPGQTLFLPIADCGGVILFDAKRKVLGLAHMGRHATMDGLAEKAVEHMRERYGTHPSDLHVWISPAISGESYWLHTFDAAHQSEWQPHIRAHKGGWFIDLQGYNIDRLVQAGVPKGRVERSLVNTANDVNYPSHYAHVALGQPEKAGRFAVACLMT